MEPLGNALKQGPSTAVTTPTAVSALRFSLRVDSAPNSDYCCVCNYGFENDGDDWYYYSLTLTPTIDTSPRGSSLHMRQHMSIMTAHTYYTRATPQGLFSLNP